MLTFQNQYVFKSLSKLTWASRSNPMWISLRVYNLMEYFVNWISFVNHFCFSSFRWIKIKNSITDGFSVYWDTGRIASQQACLFSLLPSICPFIINLFTVKMYNSKLQPWICTEMDKIWVRIIIRDFNYIIKTLQLKCIYVIL